VAVPEETSREQLTALLMLRDAQITALSTQVADLVAANERLAAKLATLEHLLSRNSANSSLPPSKDDDPGRTPPAAKPARRAGGPKRERGKQPGAPGANLAWVDNPNQQLDRYPQGRCECGDELADATDLGVVDRYQQHEIPRVSVQVTQYDQHQVRCGCGRLHTASRPEGARTGPVGYGPNLQALAVYLMVVQLHPGRALRAAAGVADRRGPIGGLRARHAETRCRAAGRGGPADPRPDHPGPRGMRR